MAIQFPDIFGLRAKAQTEKETAQIQLSTAREKTARAKILATSSIIRRASSSMEGISNELFNNPEKSAGALTRTSYGYLSTNDRARVLSRRAVFDSPTAAAMVERLAEVVVGSGLRCRPQPVWDLIPGAPDANTEDGTEDREKWVRNIDQRYRLWSKSYSPEYNTRRNLPQLSRACFDYYLQDGEYFVLLRYANTMNENPLSIQIIPPENITGGFTNTPGNEVVNGIEYDSSGMAIAYFILDDKTGLTTRVARFGSKSGRIMMIHNFISRNEKSRRGEPFLANVIHELTKLGQYQSLEILAATINAMFAVWVQPPADQDGENLFGGTTRTKGQSVEEVPTDTLNTTEYVERANTLDFTKGGVILDGLPAGHTVNSFDTKRPNVNFDAFMTAVKKNIYAAKGIPMSVGDLQFSASYSGARGELLVLWMGVTRYRENHGADFEDDIYQMWFMGEVSRGRIIVPGLTSSKEVFLAYTNAQWIGNQRPDIDPERSVNAHIKEQIQGYRTGSEITAERTGGDYNENLEAIKSEWARIAEANEPYERIKQAQPNSVQDASSDNAEGTNSDGGNE